MVIDSLRERRVKFAPRKRKPSCEERMAIADRVAKRVKRPYLSHDELLHDETGRPK